ncbi:MAG: gliding motility-associated C-terminal domain-containing protein [Flavobacteriales bacterium]|nr:gliding motility-associated C-terminal domain-containing protein [Flavobacteriales bacterium]
MRYLILLSSLFIGNVIYSQCNQLNWQNPSFEGGPTPPPAHQLPPDWINCNGTTSDTQPGNWGINLPATNGSQYIGLVAIPGWQETASQFISGCLVPGVTYTFTVDVAGQDDQSGSGSCPGNLVLWAGNPGVTSGSACDFASQVWTSPQITNGMGWTTMTVSFTPTQNFCSLTWQAINDPSCTSTTFSVQIDNLSPISPFQVVPLTEVDVTCFGSNNGSASIQNPTGGVAPYTIVWSPAPPSGQGTTAVSGLAGGTYTCTVTDAAGCSGAATFTIDEPSQLQLNISNSQGGNCSDPAVLLANVTGGDGNYSYSWTGGSSASTITVNPPNSGSYSVNVTDGSGCSVSSSINVQFGTAPTIDGGADQNICPGDPITISTTGNGSNFIWFENGVLSSNTNSSIQANPTVTTTYIVITGDTSACFDADTITVFVNTAGTISINAAGPFCGNGPNVQLQANQAGGVWSGTGIIDPQNGTFDPSLVTNSPAQITYTVPGNCGGSATTSIVVNNVSSSFSANPGQGSMPLEVNFTNTSQGGSNFIWDLGNGSFSTSADTVSTQYLDEGTYQVMLISQNGACSDTSYATITVFGPFSIFIPNVFSPNGDGVNDVFTVLTEGVTDLEMVIYDRWGLKVGAFSGINGSWNGQNKAKDCPEGTYYYLLNCTKVDGSKFEQQGTVTLIRK